MKTSTALVIRYALPLAAAAVLALGLLACGEKPSSESPMDKLAQNAGRSPAPAPGQVVPSMNQPGSPAPDAVLEARVKAAIAADPALRSLTVDINAADGVVTLYGTADTPANSHQAAMLALNVEGVRSVRNKMVIVRGS
jgi:hypothetical protein